MINQVKQDRKIEKQINEKKVNHIEQCKLVQDGTMNKYMVFIGILAICNLINWVND